MLSVSAETVIDASSATALPTIIAFNISKKEQFTPTNGFKSLQRRLRGQFKVLVFKDELSMQKLAEIKLLIFGGPRENFSTGEARTL